MKKQILQIENVDSLQFRNDLIEEINKIIVKLNTKPVPSNTDELLTRQETAKILSISLVTLGKYTKIGILPAYRIGSKIRYKKKEVFQALNKANLFQ